MPELPEVETIRRGLEPVLVGQTIKELKVLEAKCFIGEPDIAGAKIVSLNRRGKALIINLSNESSLLIHLRMTGQLVYRGDEGAEVAGGHPNGSFVNELPDKSTRVVFTLSHGKLFFNDQRKFGFVKVLPTSELDNEPFLAKLGREPWQETAENFMKTLGRHSSSIKAVILDQQNIAGVGNIYADEGLFRARVHPARPANSLTKAESENLLQALRDVMTKSIESGGSSLKNYVKADGTKGDYLDNFAQVFNRTGQQCPVCGGKIEKIRVAGRGTHFCPKCQKAPTGPTRASGATAGSGAMAAKTRSKK